MLRLNFVPFVLLCAAAAVMAACEISTATPTPLPTARPGVTPTPTVEPTPTESVTRLRLWLPASLAPIDDDTASAVLRAQLEALAEQQPEATVTIAAKQDRGPGGLLDLLRTASPVAPAALPDVILLSDADLAIAAREGLIQPLDDWLDPDGEAQLFPFARDAARIDGKRMGLPLVVDFEHVAIKASGLITQSKPAAWSDLITRSIPHAFSFAEAGHLSDAVLADYQTLGGAIINAEGQPALTAETLTQLLTLYRSASDAGVIAPASLEWTDPDAAWIAFNSPSVPLVVVRASRYLAARADGLRLDFAQSLLIDGRRPRPIGRSWNLALVARDPHRQRLAAGLIAWLAQTDNLARWSQAGRVLPASFAALEAWDEYASYEIFARNELSRAIAPPSPAALDAVTPAFLTALRDTLTGRLTPQAAAAEAVETVRGGSN
jgi:maltose-binding protein MalE